jgi:hypothetical protein
MAGSQWAIGQPSAAGANAAATAARADVTSLIGIIKYGR